MGLEDDIGQKKFRNEAHKLGVNLIYTFNWVNTFHTDFLKPHKITSQQFNVLRILRGQHPNPASVKLIRERMLDKMSDASRIVEKLRVKGFVDRKISNDDRRVCDVIITEKGMSLLDKIDLDNNALDQLFSSLSQSEQKQLNLLLDKLRKDK
jgi:DNA-binding MarR family transcriptional regulator